MRIYFIPLITVALLSSAALSFSTAPAWYPALDQAFVESFDTMYQTAQNVVRYPLALVRSRFALEPIAYVQDTEGNVFQAYASDGARYAVSDTSSIAPSQIVSPETFKAISQQYNEMRERDRQALALGWSPFARWISACDTSNGRAATVLGRSLALSTLVGGIAATGYLLKRLAQNPRHS